MRDISQVSLLLEVASSYRYRSYFIKYLNIKPPVEPSNIGKSIDYLGIIMLFFLLCGLDFISWIRLGCQSGYREAAQGTAQLYQNMADSHAFLSHQFQPLSESLIFINYRMVGNSPHNEADAFPMTSQARSTVTS